MGGRGEEQEWFCLVNVNISIRDQTEEIEEIVEQVSLGFRRKILPRDICII